MNIPGYQLGREIAVGEYCSVYNALEIETSKTVTVKYVHPVLSSSEQFCSQLKSATEKLLNQPIGHMVKLKNIAWNPQGCFLITDYFPGGIHQPTLETEFTIGEVLNFGLQIATALTHLHRLGLVHGGVSTSNLVFPNLSQVTLGLAAFQRTIRVADESDTFPITLEEARYMAPEFETGLRCESDFYSLGVVLFELLFKQTPFNADSLQQLQQQKLQKDYVIPRQSAQKLAPLFEQLLNPSAQQRIASVDDYIAAVEECSFKLDTESEQLDTTPAQIESGTQSTEPDGANKKIVILAGAGLVILLFIIGFFWLAGGDADKTVEQAPASASRQQNAATETVQSRKLITSGSVSARKRATKLLKLSQKQVQQQNFGAALMTVNKALKEAPGLVEAQHLKQKIELEFETRASLSRAKKQVQQGKILSPPGDNALQTYTRLAPLLPPDDHRASDGIRALADRYFRAADELVLKKDYPRARKQIETGLRIDPDHARLQRLALYVREQETQAVERQRQRLQAAQQVRKRKALLAQEKQRQKQKKQQLRAEKKKAEQQKARQQAQQKQRAQQQAQQREHEKQRKLARQKQLIDSKLATARSLLNPNQLSLQSLSRALLLHSELTGQSLPDERIPALFHRVVESYGTLAVQQKNRQQYQTALNTVNRGLSIDRANKNLLRIREEIKQLIATAEKKKKRVPIIGTF